MVASKTQTAYNWQSLRLLSYPPLTNYVLARIASELSHLKITCEDIDRTIIGKNTIWVAFVDKLGDLSSVGLDRQTFKEKAFEYYLSEGIEEAAHELALSSLDADSSHFRGNLGNRVLMKVTTQKTDRLVEFTLNDIAVDYNVETRVHELVSQDPVVAIAADKTYFYWIVTDYHKDPTDPEYSFFLTREEAIDYFRIVYYASRSRYSIGDLVQFQGRQWRIERLSNESVYCLECFDEQSNSWLDAVALEDELMQVFYDNIPF